jgi:hypothetical protein
LSRFGGIATILSGSDYVSTFRGEGVEPDLVAPYFVGVLPRRCGTLAE